MDGLATDFEEWFAANPQLEASPWARDVAEAAFLAGQVSGMRWAKNEHVIRQTQIEGGFVRKLHELERTSDAKSASGVRPPLLGPVPTYGLDVSSSACTHPSAT